MNKKALFVAASIILSVSLTTNSVSASDYTVQSGDTLWGIAYKHSVSVTDLKQWNNLTSDVIKLNQQLKVSSVSSSAPTPLPVPAATGSYTVKAGDTLYGIASQLNATVSDLKQWNNLQANVIFIGQQLKVLSSTGTAPAAPVLPTVPATSSVLTYKVVAGDTLNKIATKYNVSVSSLKSWNSLTSDTIYIGQSLKINQAATTVTTPSPAPAPVPSTVASDAAVTPITIAKSLVGTPYLWGGTTPGGFDCSGFIYYVYKQAGLSIGRTNTTGYFNFAVPVTNPQAGDIVFFRDTYKAGISHMGIYLGNNQFIHAGSSGGVQITSLDHTYWKSKFDSFKRFN